MAYSKNHELRTSTLDAEETLPLYEESQIDCKSELKTPDGKATPDEVRDFLFQVMQSRGVGRDYAREVAACWRLGTGRELRSYPVAMYRDIFGPEDGWAVYKEVRVLFYEKEDNKKSVFSYWVFVFCLVIALVIFGGTIAILASDFGAWKLMLVPALFVGFGGSVIAGCELLDYKKPDPESRAEQELKNEWYKGPSNQSRTS